jgi:hypothetical protein
MGHELLSRSARRFAIAGAVAAVAAGTASVSNAAIEIGEGLSVTGFADMSYYSFNPDGGETVDGFGIDQFETDFLFTGSDGVSAQVDIEYGESSAGGVAEDSTFVEQAFVTKAFGESGFSVKLGRFLSYTGWETEEPTGLFQYSGVGYAGTFYGYYQQGLSAAYSAGKFGLTASVVGDAFNPLDRDFSDMGVELGASFTPIEGLTAKVFYTMNNPEEDVTDPDSNDKDKIINAWVSYAMSGFTLAAEYNTRDFAGGGDADGFLVMGNYATGPFGITARYGQISSGGDKASSITLSPSYKVGDKLLLVAEYRIDESDFSADSTSMALEALFMF